MTTPTDLAPGQKWLIKVKADPAAYAEFLHKRAVYKKKRYQEDLAYRQKVKDSANARNRRKLTQESPELTGEATAAIPVDTQKPI